MLTHNEIKCTSLKLSIKIKEAGYKQKGIWWWCRLTQEFRLLEFDKVKNLNREKYVAPTCAEWGEALKDKDEYKYFLWGYHLPKRDCFDLVLETADRKKILWETRAIIEADCRARMWLFLNEKGLL